MPDLISKFPTSSKVTPCGSFSQPSFAGNAASSTEELQRSRPTELPSQSDPEIFAVVAGADAKMPSFSSASMPNSIREVWNGQATPNSTNPAYFYDVIVKSSVTAMK